MNAPAMSGAGGQAEMTGIVTVFNRQTFGID
jgi:hypothetical protein